MERNPKANKMHKQEDQIHRDGISIAKAKFTIHRNKGDWLHKSQDDLLRELKREIEELEAARTTESAILECGDIINYACMLIDTYQRKGVSDKDIPQKRNKQ